ncbi:hypothetical protein CEXT_567651 [Caerostris extrusa]|uniref:Uncharacterized protein n=1 Tax=Caerostris extrusa TaxID=172846 RepID=A0AAV4R1Y2_CAEEX|nr:hypothetical protein CEXT_567651 [Caerostris extrusa]
MPKKLVHIKYIGYGGKHQRRFLICGICKISDAFPKLFYVGTFTNPEILPEHLGYVIGETIPVSKVLQGKSSGLLNPFTLHSFSAPRHFIHHLQQHPSIIHPYIYSCREEAGRRPRCGAIAPRDRNPN